MATATMRTAASTSERTVAAAAWTAMVTTNAIVTGTTMGMAAGRPSTSERTVAATAARALVMTTADATSGGGPHPLRRHVTEPPQQRQQQQQHQPVPRQQRQRVFHLRLCLRPLCVRRCALLLLVAGPRSHARRCPRRSGLRGWRLCRLTLSGVTSSGTSACARWMQRRLRSAHAQPSAHAPAQATPPSSGTPTHPDDV
jgi:hypothetical protein